MRMKREVYKQLLEWKLSANRKPLILQGARQIGKTWIWRLILLFNIQVGHCQ